jgi:hypothetical protein
MVFGLNGINCIGGNNMKRSILVVCLLLCSTVKAEFNYLGNYDNTPKNNMNDPYATNPPKIYNAEGKYLGELSANKYRSDSTSNEYGRYGSPYSMDSINNKYGIGDPYKMDSPNNPYGTGMKIYGK